jgi:hypothetical protein
MRTAPWTERRRQRGSGGCGQPAAAGAPPAAAPHHASASPRAGPSCCFVGAVGSTGGCSSTEVLR